MKNPETKVPITLQFEGDAIAYNIKFGLEDCFSKVCGLRPKLCITVGSYEICLCLIHQNVKLMLGSRIISEDYMCLI